MITTKFSDHIEQQYNSFEEILKLDNYNDIIYIWCANNSLSRLPQLPNSLKQLHCYNNKISSLPELPNSLKQLHCYNNNLSSLPELPNLLCDFVYHDNPIYIFIKKKFKNNIRKYFKHQTNIKRRYSNKIGIWFLNCKYNPKYFYCRKKLMLYYDEHKNAANKIENWYLDCKYNPKYLYCRERVMKEYDELYT
jgi:hypothetical protein